MEFAWRLLAIALVLGGSWCSPGGALADDAAPRNSQVESEPFLTPQQSLATFDVPPGFHISLFAAEPDVRNPIALCTDSRGRLWVAENYTYAESKVNFDLSFSDRIVILEDTDGDGRHDVRKVFWDQGKKLTSVAVGLGGVWVTCAPHLLFIPDRNGDDIPDGEPEIVLDGFDGDAVRHNIVNGLKWGPDGWLYGRHGIQATSRVGSPEAAAAERVSLNCSVWRYHPTRKTFEVVAQGTTNPWGMDWDEQGECWLINTVIGHLWHVQPGVFWKRMYGSHFNPHLYELIDQTADHIHWAEGEKWSDIREGISATTDAAGGGHAHCGLLYCDATWPAEYRGSVVAGNLHGRRLNRDALQRQGCGYTAKHRPDFCFTSDPYFRVIELDHARDGGIYIADWSDIGECHENDGVHRTSGRIYKLTWDGLAGMHESAPRGDLAKLSSVELVELQRLPGEWYARAARRILQERAANGHDLSDAVAALGEMTGPETPPVTTLRALWCLHVMGRTPPSLHVRLMKAAQSEYVRAWAMRLAAEEGLPLEPNKQIFIQQAQRDPSGRVRLELASLLPRFAPASRLEIAAALAAVADDANDPQQPLMIWYGIESAVPVEPQRALDIAATTPMLKLAGFIARRLTSDLDTRPAGVEQLVQQLGQLDDTQNARRRVLLEGMTAALQGWRQAKPAAGWEATATRLSTASDPDVARLTRELSVVFGSGRAVEELRGIVTNGQADPEVRRSALRSLIAARAEGLEPLLQNLLNNRDFTSDCIRGLAVLGGEQAPRLISDRYRGFRLESKEVAVVVLTSRPDFAPVLLSAVTDGKIPRQDVPPFQLRQMLTYGDEALTSRIRELWPELQQLSESKQQRIRELTGELTPEVIAAGDAARGRVLFVEACAKCHKLFGEGGTSAPELTGAQRTNLAYLLENIVDPSATISKNYQMSIVQLDDGRVLNGVVLNPTDRTLTLQTPTEQLVLDRASIEEIRETNLSLMPEGQLDRLSAEEVRNLFAYLMSPSQVALPGGSTSASTATTQP